MDVKKIRTDLGYTQEQFANLCGVRARTVQNWESGSTIPEPTRALLEKIEKGEIVSRKNEATISSADILEQIPDQREAMARAMEDCHHIVSDAQNINIKEVPIEVVEEIREEVRAEIKEEVAIPVISADIASKPCINIRKYIDDKAGELEHIDPSDLTHQADGAERIRKTSILPTFAPGDIVFVRFLNDKHNIIDGHTYYFDMRTRPTMIRRVKIEGENLRLIAKNPAFGDIVVSYDDVLNIAEIVGLFRSSFGDQYDEIEAVRRKKDEQVNTLIEQNGKALQIIEDLIKK